MKELHVISSLDQARVLLNPIRVEILEILTTPGTCLDVAGKLNMSQQRVNNNVKEMLKSGLLRLVDQRAKRNMIESVYQSVGKRFWLSPELAHPQDAEIKAVRERLSLHNLLVMAERLHRDAGALLDTTDAMEVPSIGVTTEIVLRSETEREAFAKDFLKAMHAVLEKYQGAGSQEEHYTAMIVCYPAVHSDTSETENATVH